MAAKTDEGYPSKDVSAKMIDGILSIREASMNQHFGEVRLGQSLAVQRVLQTPPLMPYEMRVCMEIHYTLKAKATMKISRAENLLRRSLTYADYFRLIDRSHYHLAARIEPIGDKTVATQLM